MIAGLQAVLRKFTESAQQGVNEIQVVAHSTFLPFQRKYEEKEWKGPQSKGLVILSGQHKDNTTYRMNFQRNRLP